MKQMESVIEWIEGFLHPSLARHSTVFPPQDASDIYRK